jgi:protease I
MTSKTTNKRAVIITDQGFEIGEVMYSVMRLYEEGYDVDIATKDKRLVTGRLQFPLEYMVKYYGTLVDANKIKAKNYDLVIIPGGFEAPDRVRQIPNVLNLIKKMHHQKKLVASVCHGPWVLISTGLTKGKKIASYVGMKDDVTNSGATYVDKAVVIDGNIITSRHPTDMGEFMKAIIKYMDEN